MSRNRPSGRSCGDGLPQPTRQAKGGKNEVIQIWLHRKEN
nr:MAG TPA: hypothetical protein [Caudoviricetes sp.]